MTFHKGSIVRDPKSKTAMYRIDEVDSAGTRYRITRCNKAGETHGLVRKNTDGHWVSADDLSTFEMVSTGVVAKGATS